MKRGIERGASRNVWRSIAALLLPLMILFGVAHAGAQSPSPEGRRIALVIGNSDYVSVARLRNASADASAIAATLSGLGFEVVERTNLDFDGFADALMDFYAMAEQAQVALVFYSGHGLQLGGRNYLVPVDAGFQHRTRIVEENFLLDEIASELQKRVRHSLLFIDACRSNPLPDEAGATSGLAPLQTDGGAFVAFATQPGNVSTDGAGPNSPFTKALIDHIPHRGVSISDMMIRVRNSVEAATGGRQTPWDQSSLRSQFYFNPLDAEEDTDALVLTDLQQTAAVDYDGEIASRLIILPAGVERGQLARSNRDESAIGAPVDQAVVVPTLRIVPDDVPDAMAAIDPDDDTGSWEKIAGSTNPDDFRDYIEAFPNGAFVRVAQLSLEALGRLSRTEDRLKELEVAARAASGTSDALSLEELYWGTIRESDLSGDFEAYLRTFPTGAFADLAQARIEALGRAGAVQGFAGQAGQVTRSQLRSAAMQQHERIPTQFLQYGLIALGYPLPTVSGVIDSDARKSIRAFQASIGEEQTGKLTAQQTVDLLLAAATVGDEHAQTAVGLMMASGQGLQRDYAFSRLWLRHAAEQGNAYAQANLAILHRDGLGGKKDVASARALLEKAAASGLAEAADALKKLKG